MSSGGTSLYGVTYVRHPIEAFVTAIEQIVGLGDAVEAVFGFASRLGQLPHDVECLPVNRYGNSSHQAQMWQQTGGRAAPICSASAAAWLTWCAPCRHSCSEYERYPM